MQGRGIYRRAAAAPFVNAHSFQAIDLRFSCAATPVPPIAQLKLTIFYGL
jgi:hypothetical protein